MLPRMPKSPSSLRCRSLRLLPFERITIGVFVGALLLALLAGCDRAEPERPSAAEFVAANEKLYSQNDEELLIRYFFDDRRGGFFVDVGAFHWKNASTTLYLEKHLGWTGIAIDANPRFAPGYAENRPGSEFLSYFVSDHSGTVEEMYEAGPLSSKSEEHIRSFPNMKESELHQIEVHTITLNELLDARDIEKIDFLSMDIETGEPAALAGFDIERFRPELVCIEASKSVRDQISKYFEEHGYERIEEFLPLDRVNWYFRPSETP